MSEIAIRGEVLPDLPALAEEANRRHVECETSYQSALEHAWHAGRALIDAKAQLQHGEWLSWLRENFRASDDTAHNYMKLAGGANSERVRNLKSAGVTSVRAALRELSSSNGTTKQVNEPRTEPCPTCGRPMRVDKPARGVR